MKVHRDLRVRLTDLTLGGVSVLGGGGWQKGGAGCVFMRKASRD